MNYVGTAQERDELKARLRVAGGMERLQALVSLAWHLRTSDTREESLAGRSGAGVAARDGEHGVKAK